MSGAAEFIFKRPVKRLVALFKHASIAGDASVHPLARVRGPGRMILGPGARVGSGARVDLRGGKLGLGPRARIASGAIVRVGPDAEVAMGAGSVLMHYALVYGDGCVRIGDRVLIGNHSLITSTAHTYEGRESIAGQPMRHAPVQIGDDVWIGAYVLVEPGVTIGEGAIVGAHSLVRENVPPYAVVAGVPARLLRMREVPTGAE